jgi:PAS domain S-box-containing protein
MLVDCQLLIETFGDAILVLDRDGYIQYANPAAASLTGYTAAELFNQPLYKLYTSAEDSVKAEYERRKGVLGGM